jgi:hypothetical protein
MDAVLLLLQIGLVLLLVVIPLFSGYDKWQSWSPQRRIIALVLGAGIGVVAFSQYQRIVFLKKSGLDRVVSAAEGRGTVWYGRPLVVHPIEYLLGMFFGGVLLACAFQSGQRRKWRLTLAYLAAFVALTGISLAVKLRWWRA